MNDTARCKECHWVYTTEFLLHLKPEVLMSLHSQIDKRRFPIQRSYFQPAMRGAYARSWLEEGTIPWWLARIAYEEYMSRYGTVQTLENIAQRGGFSWLELLDLLGALKKDGSRYVGTA